MGENSKTVTDLAYEVFAGAKGKTLADFRTLAEANGYRMGAGGWISASDGSGAKVQGWARLAARVINGAIVMRTVQQLAEARTARRAELPESVGILPNAHRCGNCSFVTASPERMDGHLRATGHLHEAELAPPETPGMAWTRFHDAMGAAIRAADAMRAPVAVDPATDDDLNELLDRVVRRSQYLALKAMLGVLEGWVKDSRQRHDTAGHLDQECCLALYPSDIRNMVNDTARELGTAEPWRDDA